MSKITVFPDKESLISGTADFIAELAAQAIAARGRFTLALSGGNTPRPVYARLANASRRPPEQLPDGEDCAVRPGAAAGG